ncbi:hypothetical protein MTO96_011818 [Rhipicephalus appendiculatus]
MVRILLRSPTDGATAAILITFGAKLPAAVPLLLYGRADEHPRRNIHVQAHFTPDSYDDDLRLHSEFGIPVKKPRLRPDAVPTVFSHRPILQAKRRGAFEKRRNRL